MAVTRQIIVLMLYSQLSFTQHSHRRCTDPFGKFPVKTVRGI